jgi:hypothetical protein
MARLIRPIVAMLMLGGAASPATLPAAPPTPAPASPPAPAHAPITPVIARLPGFAAELAARPVPDGPRFWAPKSAAPKSAAPKSAAPKSAAPKSAATKSAATKSAATTWAALARAAPGRRQSARWDHVLGLIARRRGAEAVGVLATMQTDDPDLGLADAFQLALGAAHAEAGDAAATLVALGPRATGADPLAKNAEACAWRLWAQAAQHSPAALDQLDCARPALAARPLAAQAPFLHAAARAALAAGRPDLVLPLLRALPAGDAEADLLRGSAALALGDRAGAKRSIAAATAAGTPRQRAEARLILIEAAFTAGDAGPATLAAAEKLAFGWRGDAIERRALRLAWRLARARGDLRHALAAGAVLVRHFPGQPVDQALLADLRGLLAAGLGPQSPMPIAEAAGLYWEYRDLAPAGAEGDLLVTRLADRLQAGGLYARAGELLHHLLIARARDVTQGPLSARVASLFILAGSPGKGLAALRETAATAYPDAMRWERQRVEAVALFKLGRLPEAMAVLQDVPDGGAMRAEIWWSVHDWAALAAEIAPQLPQSQLPLSRVEQALVLRQAVALAMLGREAGLAALRQRFADGFAGTPAAASFAVLTSDVATLDPEMLTRAMLAIPSASPAGAMANLFDAPVRRPRA